MRRRYILIFICIVLLCIAAPVWAQQQSGTVPVKSGIPTTLDLTETKSFVSEDKNGLQTFLQKLFFSFAGTLTGPKPFNVADIGWIAKMFADADPGNTPKFIQDRTIPPTSPQYFTGKTRICLTDPTTGEAKQPAVSNDLFQTESLPWLPTTNQFLQRYASYASRWSQKTQNYEEPTQELADALPCSAQARGKPQVATPTVGTGQNSFPATSFPFLNFFVAITQAIINAFSGGTVAVPAKAIVTVNKPFADTDFCLIANCQHDNVTIVEKSPEEAKRVVRSGGIANAMAPSVHDPTKGERHGSIPNTFQAQGLGSLNGPTNVNVNDPYSKAMENSANYVSCAILPSTLQTPDMHCDNAGKVVDVPDEVAAFVDATNPHPEGILGIDFLKKYDPNLISTALSPQQRSLMLERIQFLIDKYIKTNLWPGSGLSDPAKQKAIADFAKAHNYNEAFIYALWLEETHAGSTGTYPFGCGGYRNFSSSLNCLANDPTLKTYIRKPLPEVMCKYADGNYPCTFATHPNFVRNWSYFYDFLTIPK